jgi:hypothetical protein
MTSPNHPAPSAYAVRAIGTPIIDVNASCGIWPFFPARPSSLAELSRHQAALGITQTLVTSCETLFRADWDVLNRKLKEDAAGLPTIHPVPTVDPRQSLSCQHVRELAPIAIRLIPSFHGYALEDILDTALIGMLREQTEGARTPVLIPIQVEDHRGRHPISKQTQVPVDSVIKLAHSLPETPIICLGTAFPTAVELASAAANILVDIAFIDKPDPIASLTQAIPHEKIVFGSNTPLFTTASTVMKVAHARVAADVIEAICWRNFSPAQSRRRSKSPHR